MFVLIGFGGLALILDLGSRMGLVVYLGEILEVKVRVYLRSPDIGMTEEFLHAPQVMARFQEV